jgi:hypothetical protein
MTMTAYRHLRRRPAPNTRERFRFERASFHPVTDFGPAFAGGPFREALHTIARDDDPTSRSTSKPRYR